MKSQINVQVMQKRAAILFISLFIFNFALVRPQSCPVIMWQVRHGQAVATHYDRQGNDRQDNGCRQHC